MKRVMNRVVNVAMLVGLMLMSAPLLRAAGQAEEPLGLKFFTVFRELTDEAGELEREIDEVVAKSLGTLADALNGLKGLAEEAKDPEKAAKSLDERVKLAFAILDEAHKSLDAVRGHAAKLDGLIQRAIKRIEAHREVLDPTTYGELRDQLVAAANKTASSLSTLDEQKARIREAQRTMVARKPDLMARLFIAIVSHAADKLERYAQAATKFVDEVFRCLSPQNPVPSTQETPNKPETPRATEKPDSSKTRSLRLTTDKP